MEAMAWNLVTNISFVNCRLGSWLLETSRRLFKIGSEQVIAYDEVNKWWQKADLKTIIAVSMFIGWDLFK